MNPRLLHKIPLQTGEKKPEVDISKTDVVNEEQRRRASIKIVTVIILCLLLYISTFNTAATQLGTSQMLNKNMCKFITESQRVLLNGYILKKDQ